MSKNDFLRPLVLFGPSGTGKSTLLKRLFQNHPERFGFSVSHTTRAPRVGEEDGKAYHFVSREEFEGLIEQNAFLEHAKFSGNLYGTSFRAIEHVKTTNKRCILDIDSQGVRLVKASHLEAFYLFITPLKFSDLLARLNGRGSETPESISARLAMAKQELKFAREPGVYDAVLINDDVDRAYEIFERICLGESSEGDPMPDLEIPEDEQVDAVSTLASDGTNKKGVS